MINHHLTIALLILTNVCHAGEDYRSQPPAAVVDYLASSGFISKNGYAAHGGLPYHFAIAGPRTFQTSNGLPTELRYFAGGTESQVSEIKLVLVVTDEARDQLPRESLASAVNLICQKALGKKLPPIVRQHILTKKPAVWKTGGLEISLEFERLGAVGYSLRFRIHPEGAPVF